MGRATDGGRESGGWGSCVHLSSFRKPKKLLLSGSAEHSDIFLRSGPMVSCQEAHLHQPEGVGLVLLGQGCLGVRGVQF